MVCDWEVPDIQSIVTAKRGVFGMGTISDEWFNRISRDFVSLCFIKGLTHSITPEKRTECCVRGPVVTIPVFREFIRCAFPQRSVQL